MKVTLVVGSLSQGGAERVVANLSNYLSDSGLSVEVLMTSNEVEYPISSKVKLSCFTKKWMNFLPKMLQKIIKGLSLFFYIKCNKTDVYISFSMILSRLMLKYKGALGVPIVVAERADPSKYWEKDAHKAEIAWKIISKADGFIFQIDSARSFYKSRGVDVSNSVIIPNAINPDFIKQRYVGERKKNIVSIGRLSDQKNFALLITAFAKVVEKYPDYKLCIYGEGENRGTLTELVKKFHLQEKVLLPGFVNNIVEEIKDSALFVLPSNFEGMPNALMEAMALGIPCVSTDCDGGGAKFLIQNGVNGLLVPTRDVNEMIKSMEKILSNTKYADLLGEEACKISQTLAPAKIYGMWENFILSFSK